MPGRPPLAEARKQATKKLIQARHAEHERYISEYLASVGWGQEEQTVKKWVRSETT